MGVQPNRVGTLNPAQDSPAPLGQDSEAAVGSIDMQPNVFRLAEVRHALKRIDRSRAACSCVCDNRNGVKPGSAVVGHSSL